MNLLKDFPEGPLTKYRKEASFDWKKFRLELDGEDGIIMKNRIYSIFEGDIFTKSKNGLNADQYRRLTNLRSKVFHKNNPCTDSMLVANPELKAPSSEAYFMYDLSTFVVHSIKYRMFVKVIEELGTEKHQKYAELARKDEIVGCFCLTEISHGTNTKGMQTTATFDFITREFIIHSPNFESAKCWAGVLAKCATHAIVYCPLTTVDGRNHGLHPFLVQIRSTDLKTLPGVVIGDLGEKIGLQGIDNGFMLFNSYRVPYDSLLDRYFEIDELGLYRSPIPDANKRLGILFSILMGGRVMIPNVATCLLQKAVTIATRYSAARKQFAPDDQIEELPVIEYQNLQCRLFPYLSAAFMLRLFCNWFLVEFHKFEIGENVSDIDKMMEIHALSSSVKPYITWLSMSGIQTCREILAGHGYLTASGIGDLRNDCDANCTYEGENSVLIQQTSNWLLKIWSMNAKGKKINLPLNTANFILKADNILSSKADNLHRLSEPTNILNTFKWLVCYTLKITIDKASSLQKDKLDGFTVRNDIQSYYAVPLSLLYAELNIFEVAYRFIENVRNTNVKNVLTTMFSLFGSWALEKHLGTLYSGGFYTANAGQILRDNIINLCKVLKSEAVSLADVLGPPDHLLNSVLGMSNGEIYSNMRDHMYSQPDVMSRPDWWREVVGWNTKELSKL